MLTYLYTSLFDSPSQTLVNTVNTVGVMGKGIAKTFREKYPSMFREYKKHCDEKLLKIGSLHVWKGTDRWVLNFPTKTTWRLPSDISYIESGLETFVARYEQMGIVSISFPPLGCGNGGLSWETVRPLMEKHLNRINIPVYVHSLHVGSEFVAEHKEISQLPITFEQFWEDLKSVAYANKNVFSTREGGQPFSVDISDDLIGIVRGGRAHEKIPVEEIEKAWTVLRDGILSFDRFPDERSRKYKSYLFPLFESLPYVRHAKISRSGQDNQNSAHALFFNRSENVIDARIESTEQGCLSL